MRSATPLTIAGAFALLLGMLAYTPPTIAHAFSQADACPGGTADWRGTQVGPSAPVVVTGDADITCPRPQVTVTVGSTAHSSSRYTPLQDGQPCYEYENSDVMLGPGVSGSRSISWWDPQGGKPITASVADAPNLGDYYRHVVPAQASVLYASAIMGSGGMVIHYELDGTWAAATQQCKGSWYVPADTRFCASAGPCDFAYHIASVVRRSNLPYSAPAAINVGQLIDQAGIKFRQTYTAGQVTSDPPGPGQVVRYPACFREAGANVPPVVGFSIRDPQPGAGPVLVVNYVVRATVDQTWWDFGEPENPTAVQDGAPSPSACAVQHTYEHVSADAYESSHVHHPPPGQTWNFGDEPGPDMEAVEVWHHVHFSVTAYYEQPDGTQVAAPLASTGSSDFWLAATPEWVRVYQIEGVPFTP